MLRLRCPRCRTVQAVHPGARPACPSCGFAGRHPAPEAAPRPQGSPPSAAPQGVPPAPGPQVPGAPLPEPRLAATTSPEAAWEPVAPESPAPVPVAPAPAASPRPARPRSGMSGRTLAVAAGLALLLLAGVAVATFLAGDWVTYPDLTPPPSGVVAPEPAEAEARLAAAGAALDAFARTGDLPGYRALESHAAIHRPGSLTGSPRILHNLTISWGASGSESRSQQVLLFVANPAGRTLGRTLVCTADGRAETALGQTVLSRPDARAADCVLDRRGADLLPFLPAWPLAAANATRIAADGRVTLESGNATGIRSTLVLDPQGRLELLRVTDPARGTVADLTFEPGERTRAIALPAGRRSPLPLAGTVTFQPGWWNLTLGALPAKAPLSDFQLQVRQTTIGEAPGEPVRIPFGGSGLGFEARVEDRDGDGMLSAGDRISARNPDFRDREGYAFGIHDSWAAATAFGS